MKSQHCIVPIENITFPFAKTAAPGAITDGLYVMTGKSDMASQDTEIPVLVDMLVSVSALVGQFPGTTLDANSCKIMGVACL